MSAQDSHYSVRRALLAPIPSAVADDLNNSLRVVLRGYRIVVEPAAITGEAATSNIKNEFGRRVRSAECGWRGLAVYGALFNEPSCGFRAVRSDRYELDRLIVTDQRLRCGLERRYRLLLRTGRTWWLGRIRAADQHFGRMPDSNQSEVSDRIAIDGTSQAHRQVRADGRACGE